MDQKYLTDSECLSLNIEATCLLHSSPRNFPYEIKMDKYRPYPSMISMFISDSQHPPRSRHAVHLGAHSYCIKSNWSAAFAMCVFKLRFNKNCPFLNQSQIILFVIFVLCLSMLSCLLIAALWSPTGKGLASWLSCV